MSFLLLNSNNGDRFNNEKTYGIQIYVYSFSNGIYYEQRKTETSMIVLRRSCPREIFLYTQDILG
jgi:hypothetical protein